MRLLQQEYRVVPVADLEKYPGNPRRGDLEDLTDSVDELGFYGAVVVEEGTNRILVGNHRYMAALANDATEIPAIMVKVDPEHGKKILARDNRTSDKGGYDEAELVAFLRSLADLAGSGYGEQDLTDMEKLLAVPMNADEAHDHHGEVDDSLFFPEIRMKVSPDVFDRWRDILEVHDGDNDVERFVKLLAEIEQLRAQ